MHLSGAVSTEGKGFRNYLQMGFRAKRVTAGAAGVWGKTILPEMSSATAGRTHL